VKGLARTDSKAVVSACFAVDGMILFWGFTFSAFARRFVHVSGVRLCSRIVFLITAYQC
jgi:hypothetical protein